MLGASWGGAGSAAGSAMPWASSTVAVGAGSGGAAGCVCGFGTTRATSWAVPAPGAAALGDLLDQPDRGLFTRGLHGLVGRRDEQQQEGQQVQGDRRAPAATRAGSKCRDATGYVRTMVHLHASDEVLNAPGPVAGLPHAAGSASVARPGDHCIEAGAPVLGWPSATAVGMHEKGGSPGEPASVGNDQRLSDPVRTPRPG